MPEYDTQFTPPAPVAAVIVAHSTRGTNAALSGKIDTGADCTVLPESLVSQLGLSAKGRIWTRGFEGTYSHRPIYYVQMRVEGFNVPVVRYVASPRRDVLLGRNVLNRFVLLLDGPNLLFSLRAS